MRRAVLLYNPTSGRRGHRTYYIESIAAALRAQNIDVHILPTEAPGTAGRPVAEACVDGAEIVFACGGDGTVHEALQGMIWQTRTALGVIPLGTANALARHLQLSLDPVRAALQQLNREPQTIPVGQITYQTPQGERSRYFIVMAGAGPDGALVYKMLTVGKQRLGRLSYYLRAARLFSRTRFGPFPVQVAQQDCTEPTQLEAVSAMAVRVGDLGGLFSPLVRGASLEHPHLRLTLAAPPANVSLPAWFALSWSRLHRWNPHVRTLEVESFTCGSGNANPVQVQADGEWLGHTPMTVRLIPNALRLLMPR
ncbi:diacylglycerol kinase family protein [Granulicella sp. S156]|uniref:diacylglycerol/lipid kinase family protein n=1 Tax=Granulicella sp. S156 TaxID=1747224 RepID=UPI00131C29F0|nr:diacylglycerol kinase family protein [Granulicella sp. S156]